MSTPNFSEKDVEQLAKSIGKPGPAKLRARVMAAIDEIDREQSQGKTVQERPPKERKRDERERS